MWHWVVEGSPPPFLFGLVSFFLPLGQPSHMSGGAGGWGSAVTIGGSYGGGGGWAVKAWRIRWWWCEGELRVKKRQRMSRRSFHAYISISMIIWSIKTWSPSARPQRNTRQSSSPLPTSRPHRWRSGWRVGVNL